MPMKYEHIMNSTVDDKYHLMISSINTNRKRVTVLLKFKLYMQVH